MLQRVATCPNRWRRRSTRTTALRTAASLARQRCRQRAPRAGGPLARACVRLFVCLFVRLFVCLLVRPVVCAADEPEQRTPQVDPAHVDRILLGLADYLGLNRSATLFILNPFTTTERPYGYRSGLSECGMRTSAPGLGSPRPRLHQDQAHPCHICTGTGLPPAKSALGLGSPRPHRRWGWIATRSRLRHTMVCRPAIDGPCACARSS
jgi:hypothetical protein